MTEIRNFKSGTQHSHMVSLLLIMSLWKKEKKKKLNKIKRSFVESLNISVSTDLVTPCGTAVTAQWFNTIANAD